MPRTNPRDPWRKAPTSELGDQVLPRWFVLLGLLLVPVALGALVAAFVVFGPDEVPVAERRPPPAGDGFTSAVGQMAVGATAPRPLDPAPCPRLEGLQVAGTASDRATLADGLAPLCTVGLGAEVVDPVVALARAGAVVRFAAFEATGVDSTARRARAGEPPLVLVNARLSAVQDPAWIAPLVAHDAALLAAADPATAEAAVAARQVEDRVCRALFADARPSRGCDDAAALLALPDPVAALEAAGYR